MRTQRIIKQLNQTSLKTYNYTSISSQCTLGESPYWHARRQSFFFVDIENGKLFEHNLKTEETKTRSFPHRLAVIFESEDGNLILGLDRKLAKFDLETEELSWLCEVESENPLHRFNDGKVDAKGRIWIGTMSTEFTEGAGSLYCIDQDLEPQKKLSNLSISNGMAWTEDNQAFHFIDTPTRQIKKYKFDLKTGKIKFDRIAIEIPEESGFPDGMCIDREGMLWIAHYGGAGVYRWNPASGDLLEKIDLPVPNVTCCCFVGENLDTLLITTAQENMSSEQLKKYPLSGDIFLVKTKAKGYLSNLFEF
tara:strand:- start:9333 stop:10253 length:921 start_codon:yes stop_codon:yes gene_type:complete